MKKVVLTAAALILTGAVAFLGCGAEPGEEAATAGAPTVPVPTATAGVPSTTPTPVAHAAGATSSSTGSAAGASGGMNSGGCSTSNHPQSSFGLLGMVLGLGVAAGLRRRPKRRAS